MSLIRRHSRLLLVAVCCVAAGAGISAIATAGAATSPTHSTAAPGKTANLRRGGLRRLMHGVQGSAMVHTANGFATVTFERGKVDAVHGQQLTIIEGTPRATYKTVTVTVPANALVRDNRQKATLSRVATGQRVLVVTAPKRTFVIARTPKAR